jgi:putative hydrolase of HD superfamily
MKNRLEKQIEFLLEIDKLKTVLRQTYVLANGQPENDAEHSWHITTMAILLVEHANESIDIMTVMKMLLIHDIVEIDAGDTYCYDTIGAKDKLEREEKAAQRIFSLLPEDQAEDFKQTWRQFEARKTPEAKFAAALDRTMPLLHNYHNNGKSWIEHDISLSQVLERNAHIEEGSAKLWQYMKNIINDAASKGYLKTD